MFDNPKRYSLTGAVICLVWVLIVNYFFGDTITGVIGILVCLGLALFLLADWFVGRRSEDRQAEYRADGYAPAHVLFELRQFTPEMQDNLIARRVVMQTVPNFDGPIQMISFPGLDDHVQYPRRVFDEIWADVTEDELPALRDYGDETKKRQCCATLTRWAIGCGFATAAGGNKSARWIPGGYDQAVRAIFGGQQ